MKERKNVNDIKVWRRLSVLFRAGILVMLIISCYTCVYAKDPARYIQRKCPIKRVETDKEYQQAVLDGPEWKGGKVRVIGECTYDSRAIKSWAEAQGIKCSIASTAAYYGRRKIANGHWTVITECGRYAIDYVENVGVVSRRIRKDDEFVILGDYVIDSSTKATVSYAKLPGKPNPVRSIDFSIMPKETI